MDVGDDQEQAQHERHQNDPNTSASSYGIGMQNGNVQQAGLLTYPGPQLALEGGPLVSNGGYKSNTQVELLEDDSHPEVNPSLEFPCTPLVGNDDLLFPSTPDLLTPCTSPRP